MVLLLRKLIYGLTDNRRFWLKCIVFIDNIALYLMYL